jgi:hypothetical protein
MLTSRCSLQLLDSKGGRTPSNFASGGIRLGLPAAHHAAAYRGGARGRPWAHPGAHTGRSRRKTDGCEPVSI